MPPSQMTTNRSWWSGLSATFFSKGIGRRFAVYILLFSSVITLIITAIQLMIDYRHDVGTIEGRLHEIEIIYQDTLSTAVWVHNEEGLGLQLVGMLRLPDMLYVRVDDEHGATIAALGAPRDEQIIQRSFDLNHQHRGKMVPLGRVRLSADLGAVYQRLIDKAIVILVSQGIKTFLVSLFILLLFFRLVGRHLHDLAKAAHQISVGSLTHLPELRRSDELGDLSEALNNMLLTLSRSREEIEQMAVVMAHHFQEPVRLMVTFAQQLRRTAGDAVWDPDSQASLDFIQHEALRLRSLVMDMQIYLATWRPEPAVHAVDSCAVLQTVLSEFGDAVKLPDITICVDYLPSVRINPMRLGNLFTALLDNSLKFRRPDHPLTIHVSAVLLEERVVFRFADNGQGISPEYRERVFKLFERIATGNQGTGVGLSLVRKIVETANGHVHIEGSPESGICVVFDLPAGE
ncbi:putative ATP-binding region, ATPase-like:Histidine kinase, HAMP region [Candidatus Terasakiella magnetica]|nr:putative ATP-binding region, ATPase-like:Histidine kinase, HAMP region [Candidatus Terasakiella magnetica]